MTLDEMQVELLQNYIECYHEEDNFDSEAYLEELYAMSDEDLEALYKDTFGNE